MRAAQTISADNLTIRPRRSLGCRLTPDWHEFEFALAYWRARALSRRPKGKRMNRRDALVALLAFGAGAGMVNAQQRPVPRIGFLISETLSGQTGRVEALRAGLADRGYVEGKNIA